MEIFVDTASLSDIEAALQRGFPRGITTNPSILSKEERTDYRDHISKIIDLIRQYGEDIPLSVEVFTTDPGEMLNQAEEFVNYFEYSNLVVKIPIGWDELGVIRTLRRQDIKVNCTCCMSYNQALMGAFAGANYVSLFYNRIRDTGYDARTVVEQVARSFHGDGVPSKIIVGSIRHIVDVNEAFQAGADIVTIPPPFLPQLTRHPKTDEAVHQFLTDFQKWTEGK